MPGRRRGHNALQASHLGVILVGDSRLRLGQFAPRRGRDCLAGRGERALVFRQRILQGLVLEKTLPLVTLQLPEEGAPVDAQNL